MMETVQTTPVLEGGYIKLQDKLYENGDLREYAGQTVEWIPAKNGHFAAKNDERSFELSPVFITKAIQMSRNITLTAARNTRNKMGLILGKSGSGKTVLTYSLAYTLPNCVRVCAWSRMTPKSLLFAFLKKLQTEEDIKISTDPLMQLLPLVRKKILIVDETNHLNRFHFEALRFLVDEGSCTIILVGTSLLLRSFEEPKHAIYLAQANRRIGGRRIVLNDVIDTEILKEILSNSFDSKLLNRPILEAFQKYNWGNLEEVVQETQRRMRKLKGPLTIALIKESAQTMRAQVIKT